MSVKYPFLNKQDQPINNARELYEALSFASSGFFGVGGNNFWHGGLHFSKAMASKIALEQPVMCIGDGEVVAWRINKEYKQSRYNSMSLEYSTGFVLIRHKHQFDRANGISLDWYSLYVHLLPYSEYKKSLNLKKPFFYEQHSTFQSVPDKSRDSESGRFLYADKGNTFKGIIQPAAMVNIVNTEGNGGFTGNQTYTVTSGDTLYQIARKYVSGGYRDAMNYVAAIKRKNNLGNDHITPGQVLELPEQDSSPHNNSEYVEVSYTDLFGQNHSGYIKPQGSDQVKVQQIVIDSRASETKPARGIRMRETGSSRARIIMVLSHGTKFQVVSERGGSTKWGKVIEILSDKGDYRGEYGYVYLPETKQLADPEPIYDKVVIPKIPVKIGAGTAVGYIGKYETPNSPNGNEQVHIEVFSGDNVDEYLSTSRGATQGEDVRRPIIKLPEGTSLYGLSNAPPDDVVEPMLGLKITTNDKQSDYVQVQVTGYYGIVQRSDLGSYSNGGYSVNQPQMNLIQQALNTKKYAGARLKFAAYVSDDKSRFSNTSQSVAGRKKYRLVFFKQTGKSVWIRRQDYQALYASKIDRLIKTGENSIVAWSENPLNFNAVIVDSTEYDVYTHESNLTKKQINDETWFEFEVEHPLGTNSKERGYVRSDVLESYSANEWPGFNVVKESATSSMGFALNEESAKDQSLDMNAVTPMYRQMLEYIDVDGDKTLTLNEVKNGNRRLSVREILPRLIIQHPTEWQADQALSKWSKLTELLSSNPALLTHEQERIRNLVWWDEVKGKVDNFPTDPNVYHFNPIGFIDNLYETTDNCFCHRDLTTSEVKLIIKKLRDSETGISGYDLFANSSLLSDTDKTYEKFKIEINKVFNKYNINTCLRRIHFLAQVYHETDRFRTTEEYGRRNSKRYDPYRGRGLMQLTWLQNYTMYGSYSGVEVVNNYEVVASSLSYAFDSAGWFWKQGKLLSVGTTWRVPRNAPGFVRKYNAPEYSKTTQSFTQNGKVRKYGTVDMSLIADDDYGDIISWLVNGGSNGLDERRKYINELKGIFKCESGDIINKVNECAPWVDIAKQEVGIKEIKGSRHTQAILDYHKAVDLDNYVKLTDEVPWCGSFIGWVMKQVGYTPPKLAFRALNWAGWGTGIAEPIYGSIAVKARKGGGHVGIVVGKKGPNHLLILGGNQGDQVSINTYKKSVFTAFRYPAGAPLEQQCDKLEEGLEQYENSGKES